MIPTREYPDLTTEMAEALITLGDKAVVDHLERNPAEAMRIARLPRSQQVNAIYDLDEKLKQPPRRPQRNDEPMEKYAARRLAEIAKQRRPAGFAPGFGRRR